VGDLVHAVNEVDDESVDSLVALYMEKYQVAKKLQATKAFSQLREAAKVELGLRNFLTAGNFTAFTTNFEDLHGLQLLPGIACQRLMDDGYGFGAEGDWKTAALVRAMKIMGAGREGGTSFMEDYTYHLPPNSPGMVLGAHMLEVCPSIAESTPSLEIHPLSIGGKTDPARLVFTAKAGPAINATLLDLGNRFRMLVNEVDVVKPEHDLPYLPVARALWIPRPDLKVSASTWIYGGGAHHTSFSQAVTRYHLQDYCEILGIEFLVIDSATTIEEFKKELRYNQLHYAMLGGMQ
jgi:L-arabinose isomerase